MSDSNDTSTNPAPPPESSLPPAAPAPSQQQAPPPPPPPPPRPPAAAVPPVRPITPRAIAAPPRRGRSGCVIALVVLAVLAGALLVGLVGIGIAVAAASGGIGSGKSTRVHEEHLSGSMFASDKIAVIDIKGVITGERLYDGASAVVVCEALRAAEEDSAVKAVVLDMDTPGGEVTASDEIHHAVLQLRNAGKPVITCMHALGASGGYFVAAGTDYIIASRFTFTGSIGVIVPGLNYAGLFDKIGLKSESYKSGDMKDMLSGGRERTPKEVEYVNRLVHETFLEFADVVAKGRRHEFDGSRDLVLSRAFADGRVLSGQEAMRNGLVDQLGYFEDAVKIARAMGNAPNAKIVRFRRAPTLADLFLSMQGSLPLRVAMPGPTAWSKIKPGQPYYLMPEYVP